MLIPVPTLFVQGRSVEKFPKMYTGFEIRMCYTES